MTIEQFNVQPSMPNGTNIIVICVVVIGVILLVSWVLLRDRFKDRPTFGGKIVGYGIGVNSKYGLALLGIALIVIGGISYGLVYTSTSASVVTIGSGYIDVESKEFNFTGSLLAINSNKNATSEEIAAAFVGHIGSGDFKLSKQHGTNFGETNVGVFTLGNGARAYVATTNSTSLIIELKSGEYLIVGNQNTQALSTSFSQNVHQLTSSVE
jgi:hypothetical protein